MWPHTDGHHRKKFNSISERGLFKDKMVSSFFSFRTIIQYLQSIILVRFYSFVADIVRAQCSAMFSIYMYINEITF